jgi:hypothetical protein
MLPGQPPAQYASLLDLLREVFSLDCITTANLQEAKSAKIYKELTATLPTPRIVRVQPDLPWDSIWPRLQSPGLDPIAVDTHFSLLHDLLDVRATRHHMRMEDAPTPSCLRCRPPGHHRRPSSTSSLPVRECRRHGTFSFSRPHSPWGVSCRTSPFSSWHGHRPSLY